MSDRPSDPSASLSIPAHAVLVAAGTGSRAGGGLPKQYRALGGVPVLRRSAALFLDRPDIRRLAVVIGAGQEGLARAALGDLAEAPALQLVPGGASRRESVRAGLAALEVEGPGGDDLVLIHDAARPFASPELIRRVLNAAAEDGAAVPGLPLADSIKSVDAAERIAASLPRDPLRRVQTPQGFRFGLLRRAHDETPSEEEATDDASLLERIGAPVTVVAGEAANEKLTTEADFIAAELRLSAGRSVRTGFGFDVHRFEPGDAVQLCGVRIAHPMRLKGHSDADVGLHAITDALYGALSAGDIGQHFPPSDPQWKGAPSDVFLRHARSMVRDAGGTIEHLDATLICEAPKVGPHRQAMRQRIAEILEIPAGRVSVKATTTEKLGFTGRGEGIAAQAVATLALPAGWMPADPEEPA
jgi:2-C-methyl-D-erythritol 4-phosphate cytidylyltransferase/2-C-methyl-D-erythritol 2,4-cyclodiphosphate synthase